MVEERGGGDMLNKVTVSMIIMVVTLACGVQSILCAGKEEGHREIKSVFNIKSPVATRGSIPSDEKLDEETRLKVVESYGKVPLSFIRNDGQLDERVKYYETGTDHITYFTRKGVYWKLSKQDEKREIGDDRSLEDEPTQGFKSEVIRLVPLGAETTCDIVANGLLPGKVNYLKGADPKKWLTNIPIYESVVYKNIYDGIDMRFYGNNHQMEYDIIVNPGAGHSRVQLMYEGIEGLRVTEGGDLEIALREGTITQRRPYGYQEIDGKRVEVGCEYMICDRGTSSRNDLRSTDNRHGQQLHSKGGDDINQRRFIYGFKVASYDKRYPLVIDPVLEYSTYLGGNNHDQSYGIAVDCAGNVYVTGHTYSTDFPTSSPLYSTLSGSYDAFVCKLDTTGTSLVYSTYLGGSSDDAGHILTVDCEGYAYVTGYTLSTDFPTYSPLYGNNRGIGDAFVCKLDVTGTGFIYSTYLGGSNNEWGYGIAVDSGGNAYVTGKTRSANFPMVTPMDGIYNGWYDAFLSKLDATGTSLVYSTFLGGGGNDYGFGVAVDSTGNAYVAGYTNSGNFPTVTPFDGSYNGYFDVFVSKFDATGTTLVYSTYLGGSNHDHGFGMALDNDGNVYVTGRTRSIDFPVSSPLDGSLSGSSDAFVCKLDATGTSLIYSTYLGGDSNEDGNAIAVDDSGNAYVTGSTLSSNFPTVSPLYGTRRGGSDAFVSKLNSTGTSLIYSTYFGGKGSDIGNGITVDSVGNAYVTGRTWSSNFPTTAGAYDNTFNGSFDVYVSKFHDNTPPVISNIQVTPGDTGATVTWDTDESATSRVDYGITATYENGPVEDATLVTSHSIVLTGLTPGTEYHYRVTSVDGSGNGSNSSDLTFTTTSN